MKPDFKIYNSIISIARGIICMLLSALTGLSCIKDIEESYTGTVQEENKVINLRVWFPSNPTGTQSRSITGTQENYISSLYILSFSMDGNGEKFDYWTKGSEKDGNTNGSPVQDYSAVLKVRNHRQRLVLLANTGEAVKQQIEQGNWKGVEKEVMLALLDETAGNQENKWNADSPLSYRSLPMWGESIPETIIHTTFNLTETIPLLRMVAKIDVQVDESITGFTDKFRLQSVRLYNTNTKGKIIPAKENIEDVTVEGNRTVSVKSPTIPADIADYNKRHLGPVVYEDFSSPGKEGIAIRNAIYLFETASTNIHPEATCLIVGGTYGNDAQETYYRVDLLKTGGETRHDILRNHSYIVNITDVKQSGYTDPDDAFHSKGENIKVSILNWDEAEMDDLWFDGQYYYSVSPQNIQYKGSPSTGNKIKVKTDYPEWSYELSGRSEPGDPQSDPSQVNWITITSHQAGVKYPGEGSAAYIEYHIAENNTSELRTAYLHITAGRVNMKVTIHQTIWNVEKFIIEPTGTIPPHGQTRTVTAQGVFESIEVRARNIYTDEIINRNTLNYGVNGNSAQLSIPPFLSGNSQPEIRIISFEYYDTHSSGWEIIRTDNQQSLWFNVSVDHTEGEDIPGIGGHYAVRVLGDFPDIYLRFSTGTGIEQESEPIPAGNTETVTNRGSIYIPLNGTLQDRTIYFQYSTDRIHWITLSSGMQTSDHFLLESGRIVARENYTRDLTYEFNWATAMGIDNRYNAMQLYTDPNDKNNLEYVPTENTGCGDYSEASDGHDRGLWRLPGIGELREIGKNAGKIGNFPVSGLYWSSTENISSTAFYHNIPPISIYENRKTTTCRVRCVRSVD